MAPTPVRKATAPTQIFCKNIALTERTAMACPSCYEERHGADEQTTFVLGRRSLWELVVVTGPRRGDGRLIRAAQFVHVADARARFPVHPSVRERMDAWRAAC